eukprot:GGOE01009832.1.p1 GENE.GGOE01009832.1~~GGOE01009832.1.p1  ORF type:complete len:167 (+),score=0.41 GGOE01009832.1:331-831(+)
MCPEDKPLFSSILIIYHSTQTGDTYNVYAAQGQKLPWDRADSCATTSRWALGHGSLHVFTCGIPASQNAQNRSAQKGPPLRQVLVATPGAQEPHMVGVHLGIWGMRKVWGIRHFLEDCLDTKGRPHGLGSQQEQIRPAAGPRTFGRGDHRKSQEADGHTSQMISHG